MVSRVHFKFKAETAYDSVAIDGAFVTVGELKTLIAERKGMGRDAAAELALTDPASGDGYGDEAALIPKSASVLVRRAPAGARSAAAGREFKLVPARLHLEPPEMLICLVYTWYIHHDVAYDSDEL